MHSITFSHYNGILTTGNVKWRAFAGRNPEIGRSRVENNSELLRRCSYGDVTIVLRLEESREYKKGYLVMVVGIVTKVR